MDANDKEEGNENTPPEKGVLVFSLPDEAKPHAEALGGLVIVFSGLELQLSILLAVMLDIEFTPKGEVLGGLDMMPKLRILKSMGFAVGKDKPNNWWGRLSHLLDKIENDLCPKRNRMVHGVWGLTERPGEMIRTRLKPEIVKQPLMLKMEEISVSVQDIAHLTYRVVETFSELAALRVELKHHRCKNLRHDVVNSQDWLIDIGINVAFESLDSSLYHVIAGYCHR